MHLTNDYPRPKVRRGPTAGGAFHTGEGRVPAGVRSVPCAQRGPREGQGPAAPITMPLSVKTLVLLLVSHTEVSVAC